MGYLNPEWFDREQTWTGREQIDGDVARGCVYGVLISATMWTVLVVAAWKLWS